MAPSEGHARRYEDSQEYKSDKLLKDVMKALVGLLVIAGTVIGANYAINDTRYITRTESEKCHTEISDKVIAIDKTAYGAVKEMAAELKGMNNRLDRIEERLK